MLDLEDWRSRTSKDCCKSVILSLSLEEFWLACLEEDLTGELANRL